MPSTRTTSASPNGGVPNPPASGTQADVIRRVEAGGRHDLFGDRVQRVTSGREVAGSGGEDSMPSR